ncbi:MAG: DUF2624 family protein [Clostridiales bacterium]|nr:DUF2624 family protein [Clostridiales bacterium]
MSLLSDELVAKALQVNSAEELMTLAKENDIELTKDDAEKSFQLILQSRQNN